MIPLASEMNLIGCGGFALWDENNRKLIAPTEAMDYVRVIADGPIRSVIQRIIPNWRVSGGNSTVDINSDDLRWESLDRTPYQRARAHIKQLDCDGGSGSRRRSRER